MPPGVRQSRIACNSLLILQRLALVSGLCLGLAAKAETAGPIVEPNGALRPVNATAAEPDARALIDTWRASNQYLPGKHVDHERFQILDQRLALGKYKRAFLQFRILPAQGDALAFALARCPGRESPVEIQVFYQWSPDVKGWVAMGVKGDGAENLCGEKGGLWSQEQIERLIHPPALPVPPKIQAEDVVAPPPGSAERAAIMNALRPLYEGLFGPPIQFKVVKLQVAAGFAFVTVHPQRQNGAPIEAANWKKALPDPCFQTPASVEHEYWLRRDKGVWTIGVKNGLCADDSIIAQGDLIGAPPQLAGMNAWPEREFPPALDE